VVGGAGTYASKVINGLAGRGVELVVFTPWAQGYDPPPGAVVRGVPVDPAKPFPALQFWMALPEVFRRAEREKRFDLVHFNGTCYWFLNRFTDTPSVVTIHHLARDSLVYDRGVGVLLSLVEKRAIAEASRVVAVSSFTRQRMMMRYGTDPNKVGVVYNGGSHEPDADVRTEEAEALLSPLNGRRSVLFVGRVTDRRKGLDILIRAMKEVVDRTGAALVVAGSGDRREMIELASSMGLKEDILFLGYVSDPVLLGLYRRCDVYACPTRLEGFGMTVLDAQNFAPRVVASRVGAIPEIALEGAVLVEPEDVGALASAIIRSLDGDRPLLSPGDAAGRFSWDKGADALIAEYEQVIGTAGRRQLNSTQ